MDTLRSTHYLSCGGGASKDKEDEHTKGPSAASAVRGLFEYMTQKKPIVEPKRTELEEEERQVRIQHLRMEAASTAREWKNAAERLDNLEGNHWWKFEEDSGECNLELIRKRLDRLKQANHDGDIKKMLSHIRTSMARDLGGMCNIRLYQHTWYGTKSLIEEYTEVVKYTIDQLTKYCEETELSEDEMEEFLVELKGARQSFGNSALLLSGGGTLGMCHMGVVKCLLQEDLLPRIICGSSAGSIVGSVLCCHKGKEITEKMEELSKGDLTVFQGVDEIQGIPGMAINLMKGQALFHVKNLCRVMQNLLGDMTFKEAFNHTGRILNIHVSCRDRHNLPRLLNYQTAPNVVIWSAVASSCALPWVFDAPGLVSKDPETNKLGPWGHLDHKWIDGSIEGDLPAQIMERLFNVNNFIVSQVNPHVVMFLPKEEDTPYGEVPAPTIFRRFMRVTAANAVWYLDGLMDRGWDVFPVKMAHSVLSQRYDGDITIMPDISWVGWLKILANPTQAFMKEATRQGEKATWPKLDRIRNHVAIELALSNGIKHIQSAKIAPKIFSKVGRGPTSVKSERDFSRLRPRSGFEIPIIPRPARGRSQTHMQRRSMVEPTDLLTQTTKISALSIADPNQHLSSSDERSGRSSPTTSYDDEDFDDVKRPVGNSMSASPGVMTDAMPFLSQPTTPSLASKTFHFGSEATSPGLMLRSPAAHAPELRRVLNELSMSSIDIKSPPAERKRQKK